MSIGPTKSITPKASAWAAATIDKLIKEDLAINEESAKKAAALGFMATLRIALSWHLNIPVR